ncbi:MAG: hypothetical protein ACI4VO_02065 [Clostridia bacterium]
MSNEIYGYDGFQDLADIIEYYAKGADNFIEVLEVGAKEFVNDLLKLPKPMSKIKKAGYTHLIRSFAYKKRKNEVEVGWGKYYGPMVEHGTNKMDENPHVYPLWDKNKEKYYKTMLTKLDLQTW